MVLEGRTSRYASAAPAAAARSQQIHQAAAVPMPRQRNASRTHRLRMCASPAPLLMTP